MEVHEVLRSAGEALLIGFLVGAERESSRGEGETQPGVRDFILIALVGAICGLLQNPWLTVGALVSIAGLLALFHFQVADRSGVTTEMAAVATFCLGFLTASPGATVGHQLAVGLTVVVVVFLDAKRALHKFIRVTITETEFNDTLRFLAIIFVIYPVLPEGAFGPFGFFAPRQVWTFVILVSSISYAGYFLEKFLGARAGLRLAGLVGGLASSTAATASLARSCREEPEKLPVYWQAAVMANTVQFPRVLVILYAVNPELARASAGPLLAMAAAGTLFALVLLRAGKGDGLPAGMGLRNPFRLMPALTFGALFSAIVFLSKAASAALGGVAVYWVSALGGSVDVDAVVLSSSSLVRGGVVGVGAAEASILLGLLANAVVKSLIAAYAGTTGLALRLAGAFVVMFGVGALAWLL
jgi:uncharacterized membrane protein (DUF4010 family)